ncbi:MAG: ABC transporter ATP-binding protein [Caldilineaceae bacterium]
MTEDVKWRATNWLRNDLSDHCMRLDMSFHNEYTPGAMIERVDGDVQELSEFMSQFVLRVLANALLLIGILALLYREQWQIGLAFTLYSVVMFTILIRTVKIGVPFWEAEREASSQMFGSIEEWLNGTEDIRASGGTEYVLDRLRRQIYELFLATRKAHFAGMFTWGLSGVLFTINLGLALGIGAYFLQAGVITIGSVYLIMSYSNTLARPIQQLSRQLQDLQAATASIGRIRELMALESAVPDAPNTAPLSNGPLRVEFDGVDFGYNAAEPVLRDVSFDLAPGRVLGLLGRTGSGKTTITRLLFRLYDPQSGAISLGEHDLRRAPLDSIRQRVGMVTQEVQLFRASVRDNLTFFNPAIDDEHILEALEVLGLGDWFRSLEFGLDTRLDAGGRSLSAGQAQLLAFTRVFLKDPGLVILDEASSRLDPVTEYLIERAIDRLLANRTGIIVAHRLATVQRADEIMILQDGQIIEHGQRIALAARSDSRFSQLLRTGMEEVLA